MSINDQLINFQEFLMQTLYEHNDVTILQEKLKHYPCDPVLREWILSLEPAMLEVAARMMQRWGRKAIESKSSD